MCAEQKTVLRQRMRSWRKARSASELTSISAAITQRVLSHPAYVQANTIFCYCATPQEIDTRAILLDALQQGKRVALPRCGQHGLMDAYCISSLADLVHGKFEIEEPSGSCPLLPPEQIQLSIIPCLCADRSGRRLGYGGGYYDRFLPRASGVRMLLCAEDCLLQEIPYETTDAVCDLILTERQGYDIREK